MYMYMSHYSSLPPTSVAPELTPPSPDPVVVQTGQNVTLSFSLAAYPTVPPENVTWVFRDELTSSETSLSGSARLAFSGSRLSLTITPLMLRDGGLYTVSVVNHLDTASSSQQLTVNGRLCFPPSLPPSLPPSPPPFLLLSMLYIEVFTQECAS